jgi:hypothetical protein
MMSRWKTEGSLAILVGSFNPHTLQRLQIA